MVRVEIGPAGHHFPVGLKRQARAVGIRLGVQVEGGIERAIAVEPHDPGYWRAVRVGHAARDEDFAVALNDHRADGLTRWEGRLEGRIDRSVVSQPQQAEGTGRYDLAV